MISGAVVVGSGLTVAILGSAERTSLNGEAVLREQCELFLMDHIDQDPSVLPLSVEDVAFATKCRDVYSTAHENEAAEAFSRFAEVGEVRSAPWDVKREGE
jgi:hypothetical protein